MGKTGGKRALLAVVLATAVVITPLVLAGVYAGYYVGGAVGYSKSILAIAFSTAGFLVGMAILLRIIGFVVRWAESEPRGQPSPGLLTSTSQVST